MKTAPHPPSRWTTKAFKKRSQSGGVPWGTFTVSHTWIDGFLLHYFLTGDRRSFKTAVEVADRYGGEHTRNYDFTNCRNNGWHLILTMEMYRATGDPFYLNAAHIIVERTLDRQTEEGAWKRMLAFGHCMCEHPPRHMGNAGFMVGILLVGLKFYHQATGDPASCRLDHSWRWLAGRCPVEGERLPVHHLSELRSQVGGYGPDDHGALLCLANQWRRADSRRAGPCDEAAL